uniref:homoserine dehydrogenase n=1 Tax=Nocardia cyriacigeorgica TaxID=135487 RepID=UPI0024550D69
MTEANAAVPAKNGTWGNERPIGVAVLGMGNVGTEVVRILRDHADDLRSRVGAPVVLRGIAVRNLERDRGVPAELLTTDAEALVARPDVDLVVEVMGGIDPARGLILAALNAGKSVISANKALLADYTGELAAAAERSRADLYFEAAVAGAIPVVRPLIQSLSGDRVNKVVGIVNGTTNFILSAMDETGADYHDTLAEATRLGYAEADPTADVEGFDAAAKAAILASLAFHTRVTAADVYREGISKITSEDLETASAVGCTVKLLAICERVPAGPPAHGGGEVGDGAGWGWGWPRAKTPRTTTPSSPTATSSIYSTYTTRRPSTTPNTASTTPSSSTTPACGATVRA